MSLIEKGTHRAYVKTMILGLSQTDKEQLETVFVFVGGPNDQKEITDYRYFTEAALPWTLKYMRNCGWTGDDVSKTDMTQGHEVELKIEHEVYEGKTRARVAFANDPNGPRVGAQMPPDRLKAFAAKMKGPVIATEKAEGVKPAKPAPQAKPADASDAPF